MSKWCTVCCKGTHSDAECWGRGTVVIPPDPFRPAHLVTFPAVFKADVPPGYWEALLAAMRAAPRLPEQDTSNDPEPLV